MITVYKLDASGVFTEAAEIDEHGALPVPCVLVAPPAGSIAQWDGAAWVELDEYPAPPPPPSAPSQFELDRARYEKRAAAKDGLLAYMAADNMSRVRSGAWTVPQLMSLLDDPAVAAANGYMSTLSYELAAQAIASAATPLLTPAIRADWVGRLQVHFYLEG